MCVSALKLMAQQTEDTCPLLGAELPRGVLTTLERIQHASMRMLRTAPQHAGTDALLLLDVKLPWAVLLLRCLQLALAWLQQAVEQLPTAQSTASGVANSKPQQQEQDGQEGSTPVRQKQLAAHTHGTLVLSAAVSLTQVYTGLRMLWRCFSSWCAASDGAAAAQSAIARTPLLLCFGQLHHELLPAVQQVTLQLWYAGSTAGSSSTAGTDSATEHEVLFAAVVQVLQGADVDYASWVERWLERWQRASNSSDGWQAFSASDISSNITSVMDSELDQQQQQQAAAQALPQLLGSGRLQSWLAAASSALPLRWCCNNPGCSNLGTAGSKARGSELRRVGGGQCSLCKCACYCSKVRPTLWFAKRSGAAHFSPSAVDSCMCRVCHELFRT
jgi:hypothetical protein